MRPQILIAAALGMAGVAFGLVAAGAQPAAPVQATANPVVPAASATHVAMLSNDNVIPPIETTATGTAWISLDAATHALSWTVEFAGLTGPATSASFHGPAGPDANADAVLGLAAAGAAVESPIQGTAPVTAEQATLIAGGKWYVSIGTTTNPGGEIRGQILAVESPAPAVPAVDPVLLAVGKSVYSNCTGCHGSRGEGGDGIELAGYTILANTSTVIRQIINGGSYMPPFGSLDDHSVAAVATYIRNSFGNAFGGVTEAEVAALR